MGILSIDDGDISWKEAGYFGVRRLDCCLCNNFLSLYSIVFFVPPLRFALAKLSQH